jgi:hypothetical protein
MTLGFPAAGSAGGPPQLRPARQRRLILTRCSVLWKVQAAGCRLLVLLLQASLSLSISNGSLGKLPALGHPGPAGLAWPRRRDAARQLGGRARGRSGGRAAQTIRNGSKS